MWQTRGPACIAGRGAIRGVTSSLPSPAEARLVMGVHISYQNYCYYLEKKRKLIGK